MLGLVGLFKRDLRGFLQMVPEYVKPIAYDDDKLAKYLGEIIHTEYGDALSQTLKWFEKLK
jgi:hypothetical protein